MRKAAMDAIYALARRDARVVFVGSDLRAGLLAEMREEMPERFYMEGISEAAIVGLAAGLALEGYIPYVNTIATFLTRRAYEQVAVDVCLHHLPVRLMASGGGAVYAPLGPTHMATEDLAIMRALPGMTVVAPVDAAEMVRAIDASLDARGPVYLRIAKGGEPTVSRADLPFALGRAIPMRRGSHVAFVGTGIMTEHALRAAALLDLDGISAGVLHIHTIKPFDDAAMLETAREAALVVTVEEHSRIGGLGSAVAEALLEADLHRPLLRLGLPDRFMHDYGSQEHVLSQAGLLPEQLAAAVRSHLAAPRPLAPL